MAAILNLVLWIIPFFWLIPLAVIFSVFGGKRGPTRAGISVLATALSAAAAFFSAKLFSRIAASSFGKAMFGPTEVEAIW